MKAATPAALRLGAVVLALGAAFQARDGGEGRLVRVLALDDSRSVAGDVEGARRALAAANDGLPAGGLVGRVRFSGAVTPPGESLDADAGPVGGTETDVAAALRAALSLVPADARGEILLATDGRATRGDTAAALAEARRRGVAIRTLPLGTAGLPARASTLEAPTVVRTGERFPLAAEVAGSPGAKGEVLLEDAGAGTSEARAVEVPGGGRARTVFAAAAATPGVRRYRVSVPGPCGGAVAEAAVLVEGEAAVLRLGGAAADPGVAAILRALGGGGFRDAAGPEAAAAALATADLSGLAAVVLDDLPERDLPADAGDRIRRAVAGGLGLVVIGGPRSLGAGGYAGRPLEEALPVRCAPERPRPLFVLAVDVSGSMEGSGGGPSPSAGARRAAAEVARRLPADARLALVFFHDRLVESTGPFDLGDPAGREAAVAAASRPRTPGGGTRFGAAAEGALGAAAAAPGPGARVLVVVTDGRPAEEEEDLRALGESLRKARFLVRVVAVGADSDPGRLRAFAGGAEGAVVGADSERLAEVLVAVAAGGDPGLWDPRPAAVRPGPDPAPFGAPPAGLPAAPGRNRVFARKEGRVWLALEDGTPLLAGREEGLGRSVVFASAPGAGAAEWSAPPAASLLESALRWALRRPGADAAEASALLRPDGGVDARIETLPASAPAGEVRASGAVLRRTGPSRWEGLVAREAAGPEGVVVFESGGTVLARAVAVAPPAAEDRALGPDGPALAALETPGRPVSGRRPGAGAGALALALAALALLVAAAAGEGRASRVVPSV